MRPIYSFQAQSVGDRHLYAWRVLGDFIPRFKKKKKRLHWLGYCNQKATVRYLFGELLALPPVSDPVPSATYSEAAGKVRGGRLGDGETGNSVADAQ